MIFEILAAGGSVVGCMTCWAVVQKHRITSELQKHKIDTDYKVLNPPPVVPPAPPRAEPVPPTPQQQALTALLDRRRVLESKVDSLRSTAGNLQVQYGKDLAKQHRADALEALKDARAEQHELVEQTNALLAAMGKDNEKVRVDPTEEPVQPDPRGRLAQPLDGPGDVCDAEPDEPEAGRESAA